MTDLKAIANWLIQENSPISHFFINSGNIEEESNFVLRDDSNGNGGLILQNTDVLGYDYFTIDYIVNMFKFGDKTIIFDESDINNSKNISDDEICQSLIDWVYQMNNLKNLPELDKWQVKKVEPRTGVPTLIDIDETGLAKYAVLIRVHFEGILNES